MSFPLSSPAKPLCLGPPEKLEKLTSEPSSFQRHERSHQKGTHSSMAFSNEAFHMLTSAQLLLLVRLNGEGTNT